MGLIDGYVGGVTLPCQKVSMLATKIAPTKTKTIGSISVSKIAMTHTFRANKRGTEFAVTALTLNKRPGI